MGESARMSLTCRMGDMIERWGICVSGHWASSVTAIAMHAMATQGDSRSPRKHAEHSIPAHGERDDANAPILADIQNKPKNLAATRRQVSVIFAEYSAVYAPLFVPVDDTWCHGADVCACTNHEKDDQEKGLEIE